MTYDQFWNGDPYLVQYYQKAARIMWEDINRKAWIEGIYVHRAFAIVMSNAFSKGRKERYPDKPLRIFEPTEEEREIEEQEAKQKVMEQLRQMAVKQRADNKRKFERDRGDQGKTNEEILGEK